jgi:hypothetical protein
MTSTPAATGEMDHLDQLGAKVNAHSRAQGSYLCPLTVKYC